MVFIITIEFDNYFITLLSGFYCIWHFTTYTEIYIDETASIAILAKYLVML